MTASSINLHTLTNQIMRFTALPALALFSATGFGVIGTAQANTTTDLDPVAADENVDTKSIKLACHNSPQNCSVHSTDAVAGVRG